MRPIEIAGQAVHVHGAVQDYLELSMLVAVVMDLEPKVVVEVGSYEGGTLWAWMQFCPRVIGIDQPPRGLDTGLQLNGLGCEVILGDSHDPETRKQLEQALAGDPVDMLFIDGDHTYEGVKADYEMYSPLVRGGGLIAFHDICGHPTLPFVEVDRFWASLGGDKEEWTRTPDLGYGIGALRVPVDPEAEAERRRDLLARYRAASEKTYHKPGDLFQKVR